MCRHISGYDDLRVALVQAFRRRADALKAGRIRYDALQSRTKDAWMRAAAAVANGL